MFTATRPCPLATTVALNFAAHDVSLTLALSRFKRP
jgi:hypothetical protein